MVKHLFKGKITTNEEVMEFYSISEFEKKLKELDDAEVVYKVMTRLDPINDTVSVLPKSLSKKDLADFCESIKPHMDTELFKKRMNEEVEDFKQKIKQMTQEELIEANAKYNKIWNWLLAFDRVKHYLLAGSHSMYNMTQIKLGW